MPLNKKLKAVIYARYSSDNQREASIEDQVEVCRRYADAQGFDVVEIYPDYALSGASRFRPAFQQMQVHAEARRFDVIIVEALDRLSRKLADVAELHDGLTFLGIRLHAVSTGEVTGMHVGMLGTMAQMYSRIWPRRPSGGSWVGRSRARFRVARRTATTSFRSAPTVQAIAASTPRRRRWWCASLSCSPQALAPARSPRC
jgi:predicted site-specific integrase-resolvase